MAFGKREGLCTVWVFWQDEEPKQSVEDLQAARREEDTVPESMQACKRGAQLLSEGRTQEAMAAFREAKASDPFNYQVSTKASGSLPPNSGGD